MCAIFAIQTNNMTQTPISKAIESIKKAPTDFNYKDDAILTVEDVLNILTDLLPYEREVIEGAFSDGCFNMLHDNPYNNKFDYFTKTFINND